MLPAAGRRGLATLLRRPSAGPACQQQQRRAFGRDTHKDLSWNTIGVNKHGFPWPPDCTPESLEVAEAWQPEPQDVFVSTYPKSGTTWMLHVAHQLASKGLFDYERFTSVSPFWESDPGVHVSLDASPRPRVIKTHAPLSLLPTISRPDVKHIYVVRDPRDTLVSFYNHSLITRHLDFDQTFDQFFDKFISGQLYYGSWFDHVYDALQFRDQDNVLLFYYEDMKKDLEPIARQIIKFMGYDLPEETLQRVLPRFTFKFMAEHVDKFDFTLQYPTRRKDAKFFRKGKVGDYSNYLSAEQNAILAAKYSDFFNGTLPYKL
eukprot:NODE_723_length_1207_cov_540.845423_g515_i1.p1 GENE.NODE_723_length_1207_cov_540.845423_g515_i1~~NODE_723_length_1207_cov_540.845423_g515_i1.p1  ORF type:complete len:318 (-),score=85.30 NODE_723_length_1207_cov_540.845423_g515_i1:108-1061(-)